MRQLDLDRMLISQGHQLGRIKTRFSTNGIGIENKPASYDSQVNKRLSEEDQN